MDILTRLQLESKLGNGSVCRTYAEAAAEIIRLTAERDALRAAFRVNMLRLAPGTTHAEIDRVIANASGIVPDSTDNERS